MLTGSGGPFRGRTRAELEDVTPEQALAHPTWSMGPKITVDSATLANKGLELIEAHFLFGVPYDRIEVAIQPTSIVHSLVRFRDGAALAHLGYPDMRVPISYALTYPERAATPLPPLDLTALTLEFSPPDTETFPMLALAREAGERGRQRAVRLQRRERGRGRRVPRRPPAVPRDPGGRRGDARGRRHRPGRATSTTSSRPTARRGQLAEGALAAA